MGVFNYFIKRKEGIYKFFQKYSGIKKRINFFEVDFKKPWWKLFFKKKWQFGLILISESSQAVFSSLSLLILGLSISNNDYWYLILYGLIYLGLELLNRFALYNYQNAFSSLQGGLNVEGYRFFMTVDPIFHSTKSTGQIQSKINSAGRELTSMVDTFLFSILSIVIGYFSIVVALFSFSNLLGLVGVIFFVLITLVSFYGNVMISKIFTKFWIKDRDKWNSIAIENLYQNSLIRSTFSTQDQIKKLETATKNALEARTISSLARSIMIFVIRIIILSSVFSIGAILIDMSRSGLIDDVVGVSLLLTFVRGSGQVMRIGRVATTFSQGIENMNDLWDFMRDFGKQTYPVLENKNNK